MYEITTKDLLNERFITLYRQNDRKKDILSKIHQLENQIDFLKIELAEAEEDVKHSEERVELLKSILLRDGMDDHDLAIFVRDAKIRARRGY